MSFIDGLLGRTNSDSAAAPRPGALVTASAGPTGTWRRSDGSTVEAPPLPDPVLYNTSTGPVTGEVTGQRDYRYDQFYDIRDHLAATDPNLASYLDTLDPRIRTGVALSIRDALAERDRVLGAQDKALGILDEQQAAREADFQAWLSDPRRAALMDTLAARARPDYAVISDAQLAAGRTQLAQQYARNVAAAEANRGARGVAGEGAQVTENAAMNAFFTGQGLQAKAQADALNEGFRTKALGTLGSALTAEEGVRRAYLTDSDRIALAQVATEQGVTLEPTDYVMFDQLGEALAEYDKAMADAEENQAWLQSQTEWNWNDALSTILSVAESFPNFFARNLSRLVGMA